MHYIFQQAGLLFSPTENIISAAKTHEISEEDTYINKSEGKVHLKKEVLPTGSTQIGKVHSKKGVLPTRSTQFGKAHSKTQTGIVDTREIKKTDERDSHPDLIASRSEPKNHIFKRTNPDPITSRSEPKNQVLKRANISSSEPKNQVLKRTCRSSSAYQKDMENLRSESEQRRIDDMYDIFEQAGLLSRVK